MHLNIDPSMPIASQIEFEDFLKVDIRVGEILNVTDFPEARNPSYKLRIDFGEGVGIKNSSAQITHHYEKNDLLGKRVLAVVNFPKKQIGKFMSEVLVLGLSDSDHKIVLMQPDKDVPNGARLI